MRSRQPPRPGPRADEQLAIRYAAHQRVAAQLAKLGDEELLQHLRSDTQLIDRGHTTLALPRSDSRVFVKLLPLSARELGSHDERPTANIFGLPVYYNYRLGGLGFGAWRELEVHRLANEWVVSGRCPSFPLLHHWRILPMVCRPCPDRSNVQRWGDCPAIQERVSSLGQATSSAALFLECLPLTLGQWIGGQLARHPDPAALIASVEDRLVQLLEFTRAQGLLHMDAHFENVLTDGDQLYLSDHGLALWQGFELGYDEQQFFERHQNFDFCTTITSLVHAVVSHYDSREDWRQVVRELEDGARHDMPDGVRSYVARRGPLALAIGEFYRRLLADLTTPYPAAALQALLDGSPR